MLRIVGFIAIGALLGLTAEPIYELVARILTLAAIYGRLQFLPGSVSSASLIEAVKQGDVAAARLLLDRGADPNARDLAHTRLTLAKLIRGRAPTDARTALI